MTRVWVNAGWMYSSSESEVKTPKELWRRNRQHSWAVTHDRRFTLLLTFFFKRAKTEHWTRCSGFHYGTEGVDREIFWIIKEEISVIVVLVQTSVWAHPSELVLFKQWIFVSLTYVELLWSCQSWHHPVLFHVFQISTLPVCRDPLPLPLSLRSSEQNLLMVPCTCKTQGDRSFKAVAPWLWNSLPLSLCSLNTADALKSS